MRGAASDDVLLLVPMRTFTGMDVRADRIEGGRVAEYETMKRISCRWPECTPLVSVRQTGDVRQRTVGCQQIVDSMSRTRHRCTARRFTVSPLRWIRHRLIVHGSQSTMTRMWYVFGR